MFIEEAFKRSSCPFFSASWGRGEVGSCVIFLVSRQLLMNNLTVSCMSSMVALKKYCSLSYLNNRKLFSHNSGHLKSKAHSVNRIGLCWGSPALGLQMAALPLWPPAVSPVLTVLPKLTFLLVSHFGWSPFIPVTLLQTLYWKLSQSEVLGGKAYM